MVKKIEEDKEETKEEEPKTIVVPRAVPIEDMFNHINDKLDLLFVQIQELKKLAGE